MSGPIRRAAARFAMAACAAMLATPAGGGREALAASRLYDNTGNPANTYYASQGGAEAIDDLHLAWAGTLDSLVFEYFDPAVGGTLTATARLYTNPGGFDLEALSLAGPFTITNLPRGRNTVAIALPVPLDVDANVWVGVRFTSTTAGLVLNDTPSRGSSHDLYLENGSFYWFGGGPRANFGVRLIGTPAPAVGVPAPAAPRIALAARPNPFRDGTTLHFTLDHPGRVRLVVCDGTGRRVRSLVDGMRSAGHHSESWSGRDDAGRTVPAGVYFARLSSPEGVSVRRIVLTR